MVALVGDACGLGLGSRKDKYIRAVHLALALSFALSHKHNAICEGGQLHTAAEAAERAPCVVLRAPMTKKTPVLERGRSLYSSIAPVSEISASRVDALQAVLDGYRLVTSFAILSCKT